VFLYYRQSESDAQVLQTRAAIRRFAVAWRKKFQEDGA